MKKFVISVLLLCAAFALSAEWWDEGLYNWESAEELVPGIRYGHLRQTTPRVMEVWMMRVDLSRKFSFVVSKKAKNYGEVIPTHPKLRVHTLRQKTLDFMYDARNRGLNMVAAVNGSPWGPWDRIPSPYATNLGLLISDGEVVSPIRPKRATFVVYKNGDVAFKSFKEGENTDDILQAITGFWFALTDGKVLDSGKSLAPRTGYGLSQDKRYLYLLVIDGRQPLFSMGATVREVGAILKYLGAFNGVNMDGGGSSSFVIWDARKKYARMLNHQPRGTVRPVGGSLGICQGQ